MSIYKGTMNKVQIIGNLTADVEMRQTTSGQMVANIRVATNRGWKDQNSSQQEEAEFHNIVLWGKLAEIASKYFTKGKKIYVEGRLRTRSWEGQDGVKRYTTEVVAESVMMLSSAMGGHEPFAHHPASPAQNTKQEHKVETFEDGDLSYQNNDEIAIEDLPF